MGPGRLTGMNVEGLTVLMGFKCVASMGPGRLTGMNVSSGSAATSRRARFNGARSIDRDERLATSLGFKATDLASMGPGRLTGMNATTEDPA